MAVYIITYDLHASHGEGYDALYSEIENIGTGYWDCLESTWLVTSDKRAVEIRDQLRPHLKEGDRLLVARLDQEVAWLGFKDDCETWLNDYCSERPEEARQPVA